LKLLFTKVNTKETGRVIRSLDNYPILNLNFGKFRP
jgi:hypothetical protein